MRIINAFTIQRNGLDRQSGILDWLLAPIYFKRACPKDLLILYTNKDSITQLGDLWVHIKNAYDEVFDILPDTNTNIFSNPKFEAMKYELQHFGSDFIVLDNDIYIFENFLQNLPDFCVYYSEKHLLPWYHKLINNKYELLNAPKWVTWKASPYNCATMRLNDKEILSEFISLFYTIRADKLEDAGPERAVINEQWGLGELLNKYEITPVCLFNPKQAFHKGKVKPNIKPSVLIIIQEYLLYSLDINAWQSYSKFFNRKVPDKTLFWRNINLLDIDYKRGLLKPLGLFAF